MTDALNAIRDSVREKLERVTEAGRAVKRLVDRGIVDLSDPKSFIQAAKLTPVYGPKPP